MCAAAALGAPGARARAQSAASGPAGFTLAQVRDYPFPTELAAAATRARLAWTVDERGRRNVWAADGPDFAPRQLTHFTADDGQELTSVALSPDGRYVVFVRGGEHGANWADAPPNPASGPVPSALQLWSVPFTGGAPRVLADGGDEPAISPRGDRVAFVKDRWVWTAPLDGSAPAKRLLAARGDASELRWSPDGSRLAFVSGRGDHAFVGVFTSDSAPVLWLAPSTARDESPRWSPDGRRIAFVRRPPSAGPADTILVRRVAPWAVWTADATTGAGQRLWQSPETLRGSAPTTDGEANLHWAANGRVVFLANLDGWGHLIFGRRGRPRRGGPRRGGPRGAAAPHARPLHGRARAAQPRRADARLLGQRRARGGGRRPAARRARAGGPRRPRGADAGRGARVDAGAHRRRADARLRGGHRAAPAAADRDAGARVGAGGGRRAARGTAWSAAAHTVGAGGVPGGVPADFPAARLVVPQQVVYRAPDGVAVHAQPFERAGPAAAGGARKPAVIFVHGGPPRQILFGWNYSDYYSNAYALNQYLASRGFVVLSVNYRLGIGYGVEFQRPAGAGAQGAAEYQDVRAAAEYLRGLPQVDPARVGIYGGSYGGFLTALALARNSDLFGGAARGGGGAVRFGALPGGCARRRASAATRR